MFDPDWIVELPSSPLMHHSQLWEGRFLGVSGVHLAPGLAYMLGFKRNTSLRRSIAIATLGVHVDC